MQGGKRKGAGRPKQSGKYGVPTKLMRVPVCMEQEIDAFIRNCLKPREFVVTFEMTQPRFLKQEEHIKLDIADV